MDRTMFKGSSQSNITVFEPQIVVAADMGKLKEANIEADKVVWVSERREYALVFAMLFGKVKFSLFFNDEFEKHRISISSIDYKDKLNLDEKIYLYTLEKADYIDIYGPESISLQPVKVESCEEYICRDVIRQYDVYVPTRLSL